MRPRLVLTALLLATAAPILLYTAMGLSTEASNLSIGASLVYAEILAGVALVVIGAFHSRRMLTAVGATFLFAVSVPLLVDGFFIFSLLPATISLILLTTPGSQGRVHEADFGS
jgi:hypothetical protein